MCIGCPVVTIDPSEGPFVVGDDLVCTSDHNLATYTFTDDNTGIVTDGNTVTLSKQGSFSFTCTAVVSITSKSCTATASVSGIAISKKHFILLCINMNSDKRMNKKHKKEHEMDRKATGNTIVENDI